MVLYSGFKKIDKLLQDLVDILPKETLSWKLKLLKTAASYANSRLHAVRAEVLVLCRFPLINQAQFFLK